MSGVLQPGLIQHDSILGDAPPRVLRQINMRNWRLLFVWLKRPSPQFWPRARPESVQS
jgi:hypothetical protein